MSSETLSGKQVHVDDQESVGGREGISEILFLVFLITLCATHGGVVTGVRICGSVMASLGLAVSSITKDFRYWAALCWVLAMNLVLHHDQSANHYWLTVYAAAYFTFKQYSKFLGGRIPLNIPRAFLLIVFGFATLQKVLSSYFLSGRLLGGYILGGNVFYNLFESLFGDAYVDSVEKYVAAMNFSASNFPPEKYWSEIALPYPDFLIHCFYASMLVVVFELVVFLVLLFDRTFHSQIANWTMMSFVWGTFAFRGEFSFFALVCILFLEAKENFSKGWGRFCLATVLLFLAFSISDVR